MGNRLQRIRGPVRGNPVPGTGRPGNVALCQPTKRPTMRRQCQRAGDSLMERGAPLSAKPGQVLEFTTSIFH
jgi:hypothetical protein